MQEVVVPDVAGEQAIEHLEETHTNKEELIEHLEENSGYLHMVPMDHGQQNLDLRINKSECLFKVMLEQIPTSESYSSSSPENPRAKVFIEPEQEVIMLPHPLAEKDITSKPVLQQIQLPTTASTRQSSSGETKEEAIESSRMRIIQIPLAQDEPTQINDLEDMPVYDKYADSDWYDIRAAHNSLCQDLHSFQASQGRFNSPPKPPHHCSRALHAVTIDPTKRGGSARGVLREAGQNEFNFDHNKARIGRKPKEK